MATWVRLPIPLTTVCHNYSSENLAALQEQQVRKSITVHVNVISDLVYYIAAFGLYHVTESLVWWYRAQLPTEKVSCSRCRCATALFVSCKIDSYLGFSPNPSC